MEQTKFIDPSAEDFVSRLAQDETGKRQYYRPIYSLHKWWARRPGSLFRSIILLAATGRTMPLFSSQNGYALSLQSDYFQSHDLQDTVILDPFMGGGATLAEANRLGAKVIGCDVNPVSYWIVRETLKPLDLSKLDTYFRKLEQTAGEQIKALYRTTCRQCHTEAESLYVFWVRYVGCLHCGQPVYLFKHTLLNKGAYRTKPLSASNPATVFCPHCFAIQAWTGNASCVCSHCQQTFDPQQGVYQQGYYHCPHCQKPKISLIQTLQTGQKLRERLVAIEYWCPNCQTRRYKSPDSQDNANLAQIEQTFARVRDQLQFPKQAILPGTSSVRWRKHNYQYYYEVFHPRQLLAFHYLLQAIQGIPEQEYQYAFLTAFSNSLEYNNMMTPYNFPHRKLHHLFNYHAMPLTTTPVENVVWGVGKEGAGTFTNCYRRYVRAKTYCQAPFDKFKNAYGAIETIHSKSETIAAQLVASVEELQRTPKSALLLNGDSSHLPNIPDETVDFVITDPPYFDNIHYSELSNFFYVWLQTYLQHPYFLAEHVPTQQEAIVNAGMEKGEHEYEALLASVFRESTRILKPQGKLIFTFHHTKWRAWWTVFNAITTAGLQVVDYFPVMSEYKVNPHIRNKQALDMDIVLICAKQPALPPLSTHPQQILDRVIHELHAGIATSSGNKLFLHFMGELLKTASSVQEHGDIHYEWFAQALTHFDDFLMTRVQTASDHEYQNPQPLQLRLLENGDDA
jgi:putative DNA methylase